MATRTVSPGGALLRASRMFAIPAPLPKSTDELATQAGFRSNTATSPYPTHLTITTPPSSLSKGDWGLKRPLPLRSTTRSSTPLMRIESIDTLEHVTEYASAADHTLTLQKWQELDMPLSTPKVKTESLRDVQKRGGVFEEKLDGGAQKDDKRWKFRGPWLPGQTVGEFNEYVRTEVRRRKSEFQQFLRDQKALADTREAQRLAMEQGEEPPAPITSIDFTADQMRQHMRLLRQDRRSLFKLIREFLDLPPSPSPSSLEDRFADMLPTDFSTSSSKPRTIKSEEFLPKSSSPYAETGPPKTHPSAGLSYLRSSGHIFNHPLYGPQAQPSPIEARIVMPRNAAVGNFAPKLGVAGVVTDVPPESAFNTTSFQQKRQLGRISKEAHPGLVNIEPEKVGGSKIWVQPTVASINPNGRIALTVTGAGDAAVAIHKGTNGDIPSTLKRPYAPPQPLPLPVKTTNRGYGLESSNVAGKPSNKSDESWTAKSGAGSSSSGPNDADRYQALENLLNQSDEGSNKKR